MSNCGDPLRRYCPDIVFGCNITRLADGMIIAVGLQGVQMQSQLYNKYRSSEIIFNRRNSADLGLVQGSTVLKVGQIFIKGAVLSTSMESITVIVKVNGFQAKYINLNSELLILQLKFYDPFLKKEESFSLTTTLIEMKKHGYEQNGVYKIKLDIVQDLPAEFLNIFLNYQQRTMDLTDRICNEYNDGLINSVLLSNGEKKSCILHRINEDTVIINLSGNPIGFLGNCGVIALKHMESGYCFSIKGLVKKEFHARRTTVDLVFNYSMNQQSSRFRESYNVLRDLINL